jgi:hypothetical protein
MPRLTAFGTAWLVLALVPVSASAQDSPAARDIAWEVACGPQAAFVPPMSTMRISRGADSPKTLFAAADRVLIDGGTAQGIKVGQVYFVRRAVSDRFTNKISGGLEVTSVHTAGWLRITDAQTDVATAVIAQACDGIAVGDYLEPFALPVVPAPIAGGAPDYSAPGHIILGDDRRQMGSAGALMVLDRGSDHGLKPGQRMTIYRAAESGRGPGTPIGEATTMVVNAETALVRIDVCRDAVNVGDLVALHR